MVLLPNSGDDVLGGGQLSASTELASEGTQSKGVGVGFVAPSSAPSSSSASSSDSESPRTTTTRTATSAIMTSTTTTTATPAPMTTATTPLIIRDDVTEPATGASVGPLSPYRPSRVTLGSVNACIACNLCKGYLIDATTIVECLHSFCHSCIIKHLQTEQYCPQCEVMINKAKPNIKPDVPLQSIVFKLVPELYENELRRRRHFYRDFPGAAALASPAQRGEDTEHLIFSPNEQISLSLEYAESELAEDNKDLLRARYLLCPAVFSIAMMKKFLVNKYGISERQFCVEIMYKVKTIVLPDYYTLMDVAYIYTWKRDAPMKYFYRIRTTETNPLELPEIPLRRSPSLVTSGNAKKQPTQPRQQSQHDDEEDNKENRHVVRIRPMLGSAAVSAPVTPSSASVTTATSGASNSLPEVASNALAVRTTAVVQGAPDVNGNRKMTTTNSGGDVTTPQPTTPTTNTVVVERKNEAIKLKIELNKNKYVSFLQSPQADVDAQSSSGGYPVAEGGGRVHKSDRPDKVKRKKSDPSRPQKIHEQMRELKIRIEKIRDQGLSSMLKYSGKSAKRLAPYKVGLSPGISQSVEGKKLQKDTFSSASAASGRVKVKSPKSAHGQPEVKHPIVLKIDQRSPDMATSTLKFEVSIKESKAKTPSPLPFPPSPPSPPVKRFEDEKSKFLNAFQLAPIKPASPEGANGAVCRSPPKSPGEADRVKRLPTLNGSPTSSAASVDGGSLKRRAKDSGSVRSGPKKPKLSDDEIKAIVEKTVAENIKSPSEHIVPPIFLKPKVPPTTSMPQLSPPLHSPKKEAQRSPTSDRSGKPSSEGSSPASHPKCDSPRPFLFKAPPPPPPIVSVANIPAVKPSQQVLPAPVPQKIDPQNPAAPVNPPQQQSVLPSVKVPPAPVGMTPGGAMAPASKVVNGIAKASALAMAPARRPTVPTKLPTSSVTNSATSNGSSNNATTHNVTSGVVGGGKFQKPLDLKRAQSNPTIDITSSPGPMRDTEISKLRPEDLKKNVKVYGPPSASAPAASAIGTTTDTCSMPNLDGGSFAVPKKPHPKPVPSTVVASAGAPAATTTTKTTPVTVTPTGAGVKGRPVNYLNYALFNSKTAPAGSRTPIPSYSANSPSYSPDSPQYNPNLNISTKQFKYANPAAFNNYMQNMMSDRKPGSTSPPEMAAGSTSPNSPPSPPQHEQQPPKVTVATPTAPSDRKRPASAISPDATTKASTDQQPPEKQPKVQSLLNKINIPSSLSITLATEEEEVARQTARKLSENDPTNNYIEIVKLPEVPITELVLPLSSGSVVPSIDRKTPPAASAGPKASQSAPPPPNATIQLVVRADDPSRKVPSPGATGVVSQSLAKGPLQDTDSFQKMTANKTTGKSSPSLPPTPRPTTPKQQVAPTNGAAPGAGSAKYKPPNATVLENGKVKLHNFQDVDVIVKGFNRPGPQRVSSQGAATKLMPPPPSKNVNIAPRPQSYASSSPSSTNGPQSSPVGGLPRKVISPPIIRTSSAAAGASSSPVILNSSLQPKSKTPPSILPSMASMGPMFGIQMRSDANAAASGNLPSGMPLRRNSVTHIPSSSTYSASAAASRRKFAAASNSTSLVPLRPTSGASFSSPTAATISASSSPGNPSKTVPQSGNVGDFITLHPQPSQAEQQQQAQLSQLHSMLSNSYAMAALTRMNHDSVAAAAAAAHSSFYPYFLHQLSQRNPGSTSVALGSTDSLTITATPRSSAKKVLPLNSLTVTAIRGPNGGPGASGTSAGKNGGGVGGVGGNGPAGPSRGVAGVGNGNPPGNAS